MHFSFFFILKNSNSNGFFSDFHSDCHFVAASLKHIRDLAGTFGNDCVLYLVQDSRASVRIGRRAGQGHSPLIMHLDYQISSVDGHPIPSNNPFQLKPMFVFEI